MLYRCRKSGVSRPVQEAEKRQTKWTPPEVEGGGGGVVFTTTTPIIIMHEDLGVAQQTEEGGTREAGVMAFARYGPKTYTTRCLALVLADRLGEILGAGLNVWRSHKQR